MSDDLHRRFTLTLKLGADTLDDLYHTLRNLAVELDRKGEATFAEWQAAEKRPYSITSGGYGSGYHLQLAFDPTMDHETYVEALEAYLNKAKEDGK